MDNLEKKAAEHLTEKKNQGMSFEEMAKLTGFRKEKFYQWEKNQKLPSAKIARKVLKVL